MPSKTIGCSSQNPTTSRMRRSPAQTLVQCDPISAAQPLTSSERHRPHASRNKMNKYKNINVNLK